MSRALSRRFVLAAALGASATALTAGAPAQSTRPSIRPAGHFKRAVKGAEPIIAEARLGGRVAYAVADLGSGQLLEEGSASEGIPPASVAKALTALYALDTLGPGHRFTTRLLATGAINNGILQGDLILAGGADPTLDTDDLNALARALKASGIREVRGAFKVAEGPLPQVKSIDPGQPDHVGYSPAVSGIALNFNRVHFEWRRNGGNYNITMDARTKVLRPRVYIARMSVANRDLPIYSYRDNKRTDEWSVARRALGNGGARWLPVRKPALYAGDVFQTLARSHGIPLSPPQVIRNAPASARQVAAHQSPPLRDILRDMLRFSTNLTAEMVGLAATIQRTGRAANLAASAREMNQWAEARYKTKGIRLVDHSGLGDKSRLTANAMVRVLVGAHREAQLKPILKAIPVKDAKGRTIKGHPMKIAAKTGTLNFVSGLAGYVDAPDGRKLAFAIFAADTATRAKISRANREASKGSRSWNGRAKNMHQRLIARWGQLYGS